MNADWQQSTRWMAAILAACLMAAIEGTDAPVSSAAASPPAAPASAATGNSSAGGATPSALAADHARALHRSGTVTYYVISNGHNVPEEGKTVVRCSPSAAKITVEEPGLPLPGAAEEIRYLDYAGGCTYSVADLPGGRRCAVKTGFSTLPKLEPTPDRAVILGYPCVKAHTVIRSNQVDVWYTEKAGLQGTPALNLVVPEALVLRVVRNGNYIVEAEKVALDHRASAETLLPADYGEIVDQAVYRARVTECFITTCEIFHHEQICYHADSLKTGSSGELERLTSRGTGDEPGTAPGPASAPGNTATPSPSRVFRFAGGTLLLRRVHLPQARPDVQAFLELVERSNGDAYDRTGSVFLIPLERKASFLDGLRGGVDALPALTGRDGKTYRGITSTADYQPPLELMRFITPFGIGFFNSQVTVAGIAWEDSVVYRQEVTDYLPVLAGDVWIGAFIGNYDAGGHIISLRLRTYPGSRRLPAPADSVAAAGGRGPREAWALPLFNTVNVLEMAGQEYGRLFSQDSLRVEFEVPPGLKNCALRYLSTGHGGWENGDEFNPKPNQILLDDHPLASITPWRSDCASFRRFNPASGNFWNGISSSDFSRSGWCPGQGVDPYLIPLAGIAPGRHTLTVAIPMGPPEGGSFSAWNVSGVLTGRF